MPTVFENRRRFLDEVGLEPYQDGGSDRVYWVIARDKVWGMNGYVLVPEEGHPWSDGFPRPDLNRMDAVPLQQQLTVHGGITFARFPWLGFSTTHPGDRWDYDFDPMGIGRRSLSRDMEETYWSPASIARVTEGLAIQVWQIGVLHQKKADTLKWAQRIGKSRFEHLDLQ